MKNMDEPRIDTERLTLYPLTPHQLDLYLTNPREFAAEVGVSASQDMNSETLERAISIKIERMTETRVDQHAWLTYWLIVVNDDGFGAGMAGFKGVPNEAGEVEIGYGIDPAYQGRGYTTEAVSALIAWALQDEGCCSVFAPDTRRTNTASNRVLNKVGMHVYDESEETLSWRIDKIA